MPCLPATPVVQRAPAARLARGVAHRVPAAAPTPTVGAPAAGEPRTALPPAPAQCTPDTCRVRIGCPPRVACSSPAHRTSYHPTCPTTAHFPPSVLGQRTAHQDAEAPKPHQQEEVGQPGAEGAPALPERHVQARQGESRATMVGSCVRMGCWCDGSLCAVRECGCVRALDVADRCGASEASVRWSVRLLLWGTCSHRAALSGRRLLIARLPTGRLLSEATPCARSGCAAKYRVPLCGQRARLAAFNEPESGALVFAYDGRECAERRAGLPAARWRGHTAAAAFIRSAAPRL